MAVAANVTPCFAPSFNPSCKKFLRIVTGSP